MEQQRLCIAVVVAMAIMVLPFNCLATDYTVGGSAQWDLGVNYSTWASGKTFSVGDKLVFKYTAGAHDVLVVSKAAYDSCLKNNSLASFATGDDTVTLNATGAHYYICGISTHCSLGMKFTVTVAAAASTPKSNGTAPSPSPSAATTPAVQTPSPSSGSTVPSVPTPPSGSNASAAAPSYRTGGTGVLLLGGSLLLAMASL